MTKTVQNLFRYAPAALGCRALLGSVKILDLRIQFLALISIMILDFVLILKKTKFLRDAIFKQMNSQDDKKKLC